MDGNGNCSADGALESMCRIAQHDIQWHEESVAPQDWAGYAQLRDRAPIPVAAGEAHNALFDHRRLIDGRLAAVLQPDLTLCGGFEVARTIGSLVCAEHLRLSPHCWGTGVGLAATLHLMAAQPSYPAGDHVPLLEIFGDAGRHARSAVGVAALPRDAPVEIEFVAAVG